MNFLIGCLYFTGTTVCAGFMVCHFFSIEEGGHYLGNLDWKSFKKFFIRFFLCAFGFLICLRPSIWIVFNTEYEKSTTPYTIEEVNTGARILNQDGFTCFHVFDKDGIPQKRTTHTKFTSIVYTNETEPKVEWYSDIAHKYFMTLEQKRVILYVPTSMKG